MPSGWETPRPGEKPAIQTGEFPKLNLRRSASGSQVARLKEEKLPRSRSTQPNNYLPSMKFQSSLAITAVAAATLVSAHAATSLYNIPSFTALNNSGVSGSAMLTLNDDNPSMPTLRIQITATNLTPDLPHPQHIHGNFTVAPTMGMNGPFFSGEGGTATDSFVPTIATDTDGDGFIEVAEGQATYGPVLINLTNPQTASPPDGTAPINNPALIVATFPTAPAGMETFDTLYTFDLTNQDQRRQYNNLMPLDFREIVIHGLLVTSTAGAGTPGEIDGTPGYKATLPVAAGEIQAIPEPASFALLGLGGIALLARRRI